eukprot:10895376-Heterocapsa_arctica.AAC.2
MQFMMRFRSSYTSVHPHVLRDCPQIASLASRIDGSCVDRMAQEPQFSGFKVGSSMQIRQLVRFKVGSSMQDP